LKNDYREFKLVYPKDPTQGGWEDSPSIMSVKFNSDSDKIIFGAKRGKLAVFDMGTEKITEFVSAHTDDINSV
jgi:hypothetical protein